MSIKAYMYRGLNCCTTLPGDPPMKIFPISFLEADGRMGRGENEGFHGRGDLFFWCLAWVSAIPSRNLSTSRPERPRPRTCNCSLESKSKQAEE